MATAESIDDRMARLSLVLPPATAPPPGMTIPFAWARLSPSSSTLYVSGHCALDASTGRPLGPFGRVGVGAAAEVTAEQARESARGAALALLASARRELGGPGGLDRVEAVLRVEGFVLAEDGWEGTTGVVNAASEVLLEVFGADVGRHARTAMGVVSTPLRAPVVISATFAVRPA